MSLYKTGQSTNALAHFQAALAVPDPFPDRKKAEQMVKTLTAK